MRRPPDLVERLSERLSRLPLVQPRRGEALPVAIGRKRIYILPTGFGLFLATMLATMILGGLNYNNNPALLLAFLIAAVSFNSLVQAHLTLSGSRLTSLHAEPVHAGQPLAMRLTFEAQGRRHREGLELRSGDDEVFFALPPGERVEVTLALPTRRRGWIAPGRLRLSTVRPFGLARAWSWLQPQRPLLVYPAAEAEAVPLPDSGGDGQSRRSRTHGEQPLHLRDYRPGDAQRQIAWKASARADRLLVREYESSAAREVELDWFALTTLTHEQRIRRLTRWVLEAERQAIRYRLRLPGQAIGPGRGADHRHACLRALALLPDG
ncbi:DUF58 domain-containing protein [Arenimonas composti]|uniref:DUF58 domain-containing protein n=1 Tax=Arenimonas composti TR7-09 = DSM 18010 TaxID=1121013 RepID=A0A091BCM7_9GAMM|nr:DUF58 domain-containing protein [Arenimonas composti]KFN50418.1 hypothetical protein P873_07080 [Arenimonas composti TR7-09 = DSM 18010]